MAKWKILNKELLSSKWQAELHTSFNNGTLTYELSLMDVEDYEESLSDPHKPGTFT